MNKFYDVKKPINTFYLKVDKLNEIYVREYGNKKGIPVFVIHGGPGGFYNNHKKTKYFNLKYYYLIFIDQRGCGKSKPHLNIKNNNNNNLITDIEKVRKYLNLKKIIVTGGSWGATLSLLYALKYPSNILTYVISSGVYGINDDVWPSSLFKMYPDKWEIFCNLVNINDKIKNPSKHLQLKIASTYFNKIKNGDKKLIKAWYNLENDLLYTSKENKNTKLKKSDLDLVFYEALYYSKNLFIPKNFIIENLHKIKHIKGYIMHGRLDIICDFNESYEIHKMLPNSKLLIYNFEGHASEKKSKKDYKDLFDKLINKFSKLFN